MNILIPLTIMILALYFFIKRISLHLNRIISMAINDVDEELYRRYPEMFDFKE